MLSTNRNFFIFNYSAGQQAAHQVKAQLAEKGDMSGYFRKFSSNLT